MDGTLDPNGIYRNSNGTSNNTVNEVITHKTTDGLLLNLSENCTQNGTKENRKSAAHKLFSDDDFGPESDVDGIIDHTNFHHQVDSNKLFGSDMVDFKSPVETSKVSNNPFEGQVNPFIEHHEKALFEHEHNVEKTETNGQDHCDRDEAPTPPVDAVHDVAGLDNAAESDSEDEWNYYKGEESNKENILQPTQEVADQSEDDNMSQLNPNAAEFVPVSPTRSIPSPACRVLMNDEVIAQSPKRANNAPININVPNENEFKKEVKSRPSEIESLTTNGHDDSTINKNNDSDPIEDLLNGRNIDEIPEFQPGSTPHKSPRHNNESDMFHFGPNAAPFNTPGKLLDQSEAGLSTRALFGDESTATLGSSFTNDDAEFLVGANKENDPMSASFYGDKGDANPFDLNEVQLLPDNIDEYLKKEEEHSSEADISNPLFDDTISDLPSHDPLADTDVVLTTDLDKPNAFEEKELASPLEPEKEFEDYESDNKENIMQDNLLADYVVCERLETISPRPDSVSPYPELQEVSKSSVSADAHSPIPPANQLESPLPHDNQSPVESGVESGKETPEVIQETPVADVVQESSLVDFVQETPVSDVVQEIPIADIVQETLEADVVQETPLADVLHETPISDVVDEVCNLKPAVIEECFMSKDAKYEDVQTTDLDKPITYEEKELASPSNGDFEEDLETSSNQPPCDTSICERMENLNLNATAPAADLIIDNTVPANELLQLNNVYETELRKVLYAAASAPLFPEDYAQAPIPTEPQYNLDQVKQSTDELSLQDLISTLDEPNLPLAEVPAPSEPASAEELICTLEQSKPNTTEAVIEHEPVVCALPPKAITPEPCLEQIKTPEPEFEGQDDVTSSVKDDASSPVQDVLSEAHEAEAVIDELIDSSIADFEAVERKVLQELQQLGAVGELIEEAQDQQIVDNQTSNLVIDENQQITKPSEIDIKTDNIVPLYAEQTVLSTPIDEQSKQAGGEIEKAIESLVLEDAPPVISEGLVEKKVEEIVESKPAVESTLVDVEPIIAQKVSSEALEQKLLEVIPVVTAVTTEKVVKKDAVSKTGSVASKTTSKKPIGKVSPTTKTTTKTSTVTGTKTTSASGVAATKTTARPTSTASSTSAKPSTTATKSPRPASSKPSQLTKTTIEKKPLTNGDIKSSTTTAKSSTTTAVRKTASTVSSSLSKTTHQETKPASAKSSPIKAAAASPTKTTKSTVSTTNAAAPTKTAMTTAAQRVASARAAAATAPKTASGAPRPTTLASKSSTTAKTGASSATAPKAPKPTASSPRTAAAPKPRTAPSSATTLHKTATTKTTTSSSKVSGPDTEKQIKDNVNKLTASRTISKSATSTTAKASLTRKAEIKSTLTARTTASTKSAAPITKSTISNSKKVPSTTTTTKTKPTKLEKPKENGISSTVVTLTDEITVLKNDNELMIVKDISPITDDNKLIIDTALISDQPQMTD